MTERCEDKQLLIKLETDAQADLVGADMESSCGPKPCGEQQGEIFDPDRADPADMLPPDRGIQLQSVVDFENISDNQSVESLGEPNGGFGGDELRPDSITSLPDEKTDRKSSIPGDFVSILSVIADRVQIRPTYLI